MSLNITRLTILLAIITTAQLRADAVTYTISESNGEFSYGFTLTNTGAAGGTLFDLFLRLPTEISNINTAEIGKPIGWGDANGGLVFFGADTNSATSFVEWAAGSSGLFDLPIDDSLSGFSLALSVAVDMPIQFAVNGSTNFEDAREVTTIPEPSLFNLLVLMGVAIGILARFQAWNSRP
jgi:hypothetical protein